MTGTIKFRGKIIRVNCKRCGGIMAKWERFPPELETNYPDTFDKICGYCLTKGEIEMHINDSEKKCGEEM